MGSGVPGRVGEAPGELIWGGVPPPGAAVFPLRKETCRIQLLEAASPCLRHKARNKSVLLQIVLLTGFVPLDMCLVLGCL